MNTNILQNLIDKVNPYLFRRIGLSAIPIYLDLTSDFNCLGEYHHRGFIVVNPYCDVPQECIELYDDNLGYNFNNHYERLVFVLCHELGHYIQHKKFEKWYFKENKRYFDNRDACTWKELTNMPLERCANKIGLILFKEIKQKILVEGLTNLNNVLCFNQVKGL